MAVKKKQKGEDKLIRIRRKGINTEACGIEILAKITGIDLDELFLNILVLSFQGLIQPVLTGRRPVANGVVFRLARDFPEVLEIRQQIVSLSKPTKESYEYLKVTMENIFGPMPKQTDE
ncbi:hypothetical protein ES705_35855 [subsurface metagenome]